LFASYNEHSASGQGFLKLCFEHRLQEFAGAIPEVRFNRVDPLSKR
jgi:hypothetical protein